MRSRSSESYHLDLLAVCLGHFNGLDHFYTHTGKWLTSSSIRTRFVVKKFITDPHELWPVLDELPPPDTPAETIRLLQELRTGPSRRAGASLINKMQKFQTEARRVYQSHVTKLNSASKALGSSEVLMTLNEIADCLLPSSMKQLGRFSPQVLYAVHLALRQDDLTFHALATRGNQQSYFFTAISDKDFELAHSVEDTVRRFYEDPKRLQGSLRDEDLKGSELGSFILRARKAVDNSRKGRDWSASGMLGPSKKPNSPLLAGWTAQDLKIVHFLDRWAVAQMFSRVSQFHWVGSAILRAIGRYEEADYLTNAIGWVFLQEIGWVMPWEVQARHSLRLPGVQLSRSGGIGKFPEDSSPLVLGRDVFEATSEYPGRKSSSGTVYCIDSESTLDIDDGVSLERTEVAGEYWVHIYVADPASRLAHDSWPATRAALIPQTIYLPGHYHSMFQDPAVQDMFSLAAGKPSLTFSAKVNEEGALLDYKIEPTNLESVVYMTPEEVSTICGDEKLPFSVPTQSFAVGTVPTKPAPTTKKITAAGDLSAREIEDLQTLSRLGNKIQGRRNEKGAVPFYMPRPKVEVSLEHAQVNEAPGGFMHCTGDPYIRISYESSSGNQLVSSLMQLAGEVAARWCHQRGIPIPYRVQDPGPQNKKAIDAFTRDIFYPQLAAGKQPPPDQWRTLRSLIGTQELTSKASPLYTMGLDMYTKATSPLRRYGDLLVHWQIEAALLEEARRGTSLVGNSDDGFLPFKRAELDRHVLPQLRVRERHARLLDNLDGTAEWVLQALVRAWRYGENADALPKTFRFTVGDVVARRSLLGRIDWFDRPATIEAGGLNGVALLREVRAGDVFEVELSDVNVYLRQIIVKALRKIE